MKFLFKSEFYFTLYFHIFIYLKVVYPYFSLSSEIVLFSSLVLTVLLSFLVTKSLYKVKLIKFVLFTIFILALFTYNLLVFPQYEHVLTYFGATIIYAILPALLLVFIENYKLVFDYHIIFSFLTFLLLIREPVTSYALTGGYMPFGFTLLNLVISGFILGFMKYRNYFYLTLSVMVSAIILIYGNKSAFLIAIILILMAYYVYSKNFLKKIIIPVLIFGALFGKQLLIIAIDQMINLGYRNYSILTFKQLLSSESSVNVTSLRTDIWKNAIELILDNPLGYGIGYFESIFEIYPHNVFLNIFIDFGILGFTVFLIIILYSIYKIFTSKNNYLRILRIGMLLLWFFSMQVSLTYWNVIQFWMFFALIIIPIDKDLTNDIGESKLVSMI